MSFDVAADAYDRFMGRFSEPLTTVFADHAAVRAGESALDVGCGPGVLAAELATRLGTGAVTAIGPSQPFVEAARRRLPGVDVRLGAARGAPLRGRPRGRRGGRRLSPGRPLGRARCCGLP